MDAIHNKPDTPSVSTDSGLRDRAARFDALAKIGLTSNRELCKLADLARDNAADGAFVEIGSYKGTSALAILHGQAEAGKRPLGMGVSRAARQLILSNARFGRFEREGSMLIARRFCCGDPSLDSPQQRAEFLADFERFTALHNWRLRASYAAFLLARAAYFIAKRVCLVPLIRAGLRSLGIRTLFGRTM